MAAIAEPLADADAAFGRREYAAAVALYQQAAERAEKAGDTSTQVQAFAMAARGFLIQDQPQEGRPWIQRAASLASTADPPGWSRFLGVRGRFEWKDGDLSAATATFIEMYDYCLDHQLHDRAIDAAHMVAITGGPDEQVLWAQKGIAAAEQGQVDSWLGPLWNNLGTTHDDAGRYDDALQAYLKARHYHWKVGDEQAKLIADWAVGRTYRRLERYDQALQWLRPVLAWAERRYDEQATGARAEWVGMACWDLGEIAAANSEMDAALQFLRRAQLHLKEADMAEWDATGWQDLSDRIDALNQNK